MSTPSKDAQVASEPRSRRTVLTAALAAAAATAAHAVTDPLPVHAAGDDGQVVNVGDTFLDVQSTTYFSNATNGNTVLSAVSSSAGGHGGGIGLSGASSRNYGVYGYSDRFAGVTLGRVSFQGVSGVATIPAGRTKVTVSPFADITGDSFVLLTPKANLGARGLWFTTNATNDTFTIRMSTSRSTPTKVAWLLLD